MLTKELPPQLERGMESIKEALYIAKNGIKALMASNIVLSFFVAWTLNFLWS